MKKRELKRMPKYWICYDCVKEKHPNWGDPGVNTVIKGLCGHCRRNDETTLTPVCDFPKPGFNPVWD